MAEEITGRLAKKLIEACESIGGEPVHGFPVCLADNVEVHLEGVEWFEPATVHVIGGKGEPKLVRLEL